ncbi:MAG: FHA domain-containing protein [Phycisphaerales bacterium]|nr:FHA domain-containing protein [Phycisphaerales bacterium]
MNAPMQLVSIGGAQSVQIMLEDPRQILIGRSRDCDVITDSPQTSRQHAQINWQPTNESWMLTDLGSRSGTQLNGEKIPSGLPCALRPGDRIGLPDLMLQFRPKDADQSFGHPSRRIQLDTIESPGELVESTPEKLAAELDRNRLASLLDFSRSIHDAADEQSVFKKVLHAVTAGSAFKDAAVISSPDETGQIEILLAAGELMAAAPDRFSFTLLNMAARGKPARFIESGGSIAESLSRFQVQAAVATPFILGNATASVLYVDSVDPAIPQDTVEGDIDFIIGLSQLASIALANLSRADLERRFAEARSSMFEGTVRALASAIDAKDPYTRGHSDRVALLSSQLARALGHPDSAIEAARVCGQVHDVGKIGVPESVLTKPGGLSDEEFDLIKQHPDIGYRILSDIPAMQKLLGGVRHHHERWDGRGYPDGLAGEDIPELGRLVAVVDAFDAMRSARAYRSGMKPEHALEEIRKSSGSQFDPEMAEAFLKINLDAYNRMLEDVSGEENQLPD